MKTYFISDGICVKIGKSDDPVDRLKSLQTAHHKPLSLLLVHEGDRELALHLQFKKDRQQGEWFALSDQIRAYLLAENVDLFPIRQACLPYRCIGTDTKGRRCKLRSADTFCPHCPVGPMLCLSDETERKLALAEWETLEDVVRLFGLRYGNGSGGVR